MRPGLYNFTRSVTEVIPLDSRAEAVQPAGWTAVNNALVSQFNYRLDMLGDYTDFTQLFRKYKINKCKTEIYFSANSTLNDTTNGNLSTQQVLLYTNVNRTGLPGPSGMTEQHFLDTQTSRRYVGVTGQSRPIVIWQDLMQLGNVYASDGQQNRDFTIVKPRFVSTREPTTEHYGLNVRIQAMAYDRIKKEPPMPQPSGDGNANPMYMKVVHTFYFTCAGVE